ncbi:MAG: bifunctional UDP-N-acetylglucosamine diphosphorylase/glucosamine-1-phosphate N-acetyltransferase GlmU [Candidatus Dormibacteraceae bacterium]
MIDLVVEACLAAGTERPIAVLNPTQPEVSEHLRDRCEVVMQPEPKGTGHALSMVPTDRLRGDVLVLNGDAPLIRAETIQRFVERHREAGAAVTIATVIEPGREDGRVIRDAGGRFLRIVEHRDASPDERAVTEINAGLYCFRSEDLPNALALLGAGNAAGEFYLTDAVAMLNPVQTVAVEDPEEAAGINDRVQLAAAERTLRRRILRDLMLSGVTVRDPDSTFVAAGATVGPDTVIEPFTFLREGTTVGAGCSIGPYADIGESQIGDGCRVEHSWLRGTVLGDGCDCGPFVRIRSGTEIAAGVHVGSFAEINRTRIGEGSKVPHFSYLGDAVIGRDVNIGAGTVTANYDGVSKNRTVIEDGSFLGVGSLLRAPVRLGRKSRTGAGAVVLADVPDETTVAGVPAREIGTGLKDKG